MPEEATTPSETAPAAPALGSGSKALRWFELSLVLLVCFGGALLNSIQILRNGAPSIASQQNMRWSFQFLEEVIGLLLLGYVLWRRKMSISDLGLRWTGRDLLTGFLITLAGYLSYAVGYSIVHFIQQALFHPTVARTVSVRAIFGHPSLMAIPLALLNPFFEELIVRAYLMTEIGELTGSWMLAVAVSVAVQTAYHLYYGWLTALSLGFQFLLFALYYAKTRRATPIVLAHGIFDLWALVRLM